MKYGLSASSQLSNFLSAAGLGLVLSLLYYTIVFIRSAISEKKVFIVVQDVLFCVSASFLFFVFFQVYSYGEVRLELVFAAFSGFFLSAHCFRELFSGVYKRGIAFFHSLLKAFFSPLTVVVLLIKKLLIFLTGAFKNIKSKVRIKMNKTKEKEHDKADANKQKRGFRKKLKKHKENKEENEKIT